MVQSLLSRGHFSHSLSIIYSLHLLVKQLQHHAPTFLIGASANTTSAPVGINPKCGIPRVGFEDSIGNIANIIACSFSILVLLFLIVHCNRRKAAVGKSRRSPTCRPMIF